MHSHLIKTILKKLSIFVHIHVYIMSVWNPQVDTESTLHIEAGLFKDVASLAS